MGFQLEVDLVAAAHALDLLTSPSVFDPKQARAMTRASANLIVAHMGLTTGGGIGAQTAKTVDGGVADIAAITCPAKAVRDDVLVLAHGGPISSPEDASFILDRCPGVAEFYGASSMERLPTDIAITVQVRSFGSLTPNRRPPIRA